MLPGCHALQTGEVTTVPEDPGEPTELCDLCGAPIAQDAARYERVHDAATDRDFVLTACGELHQRALARQYGASPEAEQ